MDALTQNLDSVMSMKIDNTKYFTVLSIEHVHLIEKIRTDLQSDHYDHVKEECFKMLESIESIDSMDSTCSLIIRNLPLFTVLKDLTLSAEQNEAKDFLKGLLSKKRFDSLEKSMFFNHYINYKYNLVCSKYWFLKPEVYFTYRFHEVISNHIPLIEYNLNGSGQGYRISTIYNYKTDLDSLMFNPVPTPTLFDYEISKEFYEKIENNIDKFDKSISQEIDLFLFILKKSYESKSFLAFYLE